MGLWEDPDFYASAPALPQLTLAKEGSTAIMQRCLLKTPIVCTQRTTKENQKALSTARDVEESFRREARALSSLKGHPNIVVFVCEAPANVGIVLEEVVGATTLYDHPNQHTLFSLLSDWYAQLVSAVLHIHSHGSDTTISPPVTS
jgi:serine/threonine protein kinase